WVRRTQALTPPSDTATQSGVPSAPVRDVPMNIPPLPAEATRAAAPSPAAEPAQAPVTPPPAQPPGSSPRAGVTPAAPAPAPGGTPPIPPASAPAATTAGAGLATAAQPLPAAEAPASPGPGQGQIVTSLEDVGVNETPTLLGDMSPLTILERARATTRQTVPPPFPPHPLPKPPSPRAVSSLAPSTRGFEISDNQSPMPQDRVYFTFNYFNNLNAALNKKFESPVDQLRAY